MEIKNKKKFIEDFKFQVRLQRDYLFNSTVTEKEQLEVLEQLNNVLSKKRIVKLYSNRLRNGLRNELGDELWNELRNELKNELKNELRNELWNELKNELWDELWEYYESIWVIVLKELMPNLKVIKKNKDKIRILQLLIKNRIGYLLISKKYLIAIPFPLISLDENKRLHNESREAVSWNFGRKEYFLHGVKLDKELHNKIMNKTLSVQEAINLKNIEQREIALRCLGYENILKNINAKIIDEHITEWGVYQLFEADFKDDNVPAKLLKIVCPSTKKNYILRTHPDMKTCSQALAWSFQIKEYEYILEKET